MLHNTDKRRARRAWPIHAYVGANGAGKSAAMVWDSLPSLDLGRPVLSTVRLLDWRNPRPCSDSSCPHPEHQAVVLHGPRRQGEPWPPAITHMAAHPLWVPFTDWQQLLDAEHCDVLMDEVTGVASSRESHAMPAPVANKLVQLRRADVVVRWSAPSWARADKIIRETSQAVTYAKGYMAKVDRSGDRLWRNRRLFKWTTYDAGDFEEFTVGKREQLKPMVRDFHWGPSSPAFKAYDTFDAVATIGTVTDTGRCYRCGGRRSIPKCSCGDVHDEVSGGSAWGPAEGGVTPGTRSASGRSLTVLGGE